MINAVELEDGDTVNFILGPDGHYYIAEAAKAMQHSRSQADGYYDNGCPILTDDAD